MLILPLIRRRRSLNIQSSIFNSQFYRSGSSKIDQTHPERHQHESEPAQRAFRGGNNSLYPYFHFFWKRKIRQPLNNHNQSKDAQEKFHILKACPIPG